MRKLGLIFAAGLAVALLTALIAGMSVPQMIGGFCLGAVWMIGAAILVNSTSSTVCSCDEYGEELSWMGGSMDGFGRHDEPSTYDAGQHHVC
jgi:hypothetical protein